MSTQPPHRLLVVADEAADGIALHELLRRHTGTSQADVLIVAPALNPPLRRWRSDTDRAADDARRRLDRCLDMLADAGIPASGLVGDADPLTAIDDALAWFPADELVVVTHPSEQADWRAQDLAERAMSRFNGPTAILVAGAARPQSRPQAPAVWHSRVAA